MFINIREISNTAPAYCLGYDYPQGRPELRTVLKDYLKKTRNICCDADNIIITTGSKQSLTIIAKALLGSPSQVLIEDPTNINVRNIFSYHSAQIIPLPIDKDGPIPDDLRNYRSPALIFTTPSHQYPMGSIMPARICSQK